MAQIPPDELPLQTQSKQATNNALSTLPNNFHQHDLDLDLDLDHDHDATPESNEDIDILELRQRMWKDQLLLSKLQGTSNKAQSAGQSKSYSNKCCQCSLVRQPRPTRKTQLRAEDGVLHYMLKVMRDCDARGFVYGILPNTGPAVTGSSDNLRAWWKDTVAFDRNAPPSLLNPEALSPIVEQCLESYLHKLQDMNDHTIGSILSALIQHCKPPQRSCPLDQGMAPPWWPTGKETWWGLQGPAHAQLGPPPYRKPHDLRKGWKLSLLAAVIKHMSPRFDHIRSLVWQSKRLQHKMSAKDVDIWSRVLNQEEVLVEQTKRALVITPLEDQGGDEDNSRDRENHDSINAESDTRKRKWGFGNENWCQGSTPVSASEDLSPTLDPPLHGKPEETFKMAEEQGIESQMQWCGSNGGDGGSDSLRKLLVSENVEGSSVEDEIVSGSGELWPALELDENLWNELLLLFPAPADFFFCLCLKIKKIPILYPPSNNSQNYAYFTNGAGQKTKTDVPFETI